MGRARAYPISPQEPENKTCTETETAGTSAVMINAIKVLRAIFICSLLIPTIKELEGPPSTLADVVCQVGQPGFSMNIFDLLTTCNQEGTGAEETQYIYLGKKLL
jgi:hypothetical protein